MLKQLSKLANYTLTENGDLTNSTSGSYCLDLFAGGINSYNLTNLINRALAEDTDLALRIIAYLSDIRGGQGNRDLLKIALLCVANGYPSKMNKVLDYISFYNRWDLYYVLVGTDFEVEAFKRLKEEVLKSIDTKTPSLVFKWLKSENTSSKESRKLGLLTAKRFGLSLPIYRKMLAAGRKQLKEAVVETYMSSKNYGSIDYSKVCSNASMKYRNAFKRNDGERYNEYLESVKSGKSKINASVLYPHEIIHKYNDCHSLDNSLEQLWDALPNYLENNKTNILPVIDVSGSMFGCGKVSPIDISVGLGMYLAEHINGEFKNHFITFSSRPQLQQIKGDTLYSKKNCVMNSDWGMNTDIMAVFNLVLKTAVDNELPQSELPDVIIIISDMQFDSCCRNKTSFDAIKEDFENNGYELPTLIFWNCHNNSEVFPVKTGDKNTVLLSGNSPVVMKYLFTGEIEDPYQAMLKVVMQPRYDLIVGK